MAVKYQSILLILSLIIIAHQIEIKVDTSEVNRKIDPRIKHSQINPFAEEDEIGNKHLHQYHQQNGITQQIKTIANNQVQTIASKNYQNSGKHYESIDFQENESNAQKNLEKNPTKIYTAFRRSSQTKVEDREGIQFLKDDAKKIQHSLLQKTSQERTTTQFQSDFINHQEKALYYRFIQFIANFAETVIKGIPNNERNNTQNATEMNSSSIISKLQINPINPVSNNTAQQLKMNTLQLYGVKNQMIIKDAHQLRRRKKLYFIVSIFSFGLICVGLIKLSESIQKENKKSRGGIMKLPSEEYEIQQI